MSHEAQKQVDDCDSSGSARCLNRRPASVCLSQMCSRELMSARLYVPSTNEATHPRCCDEGCPDGPGRASNKEGESWGIIPKALSESTRQNRAMQWPLRRAAVAA